MNILRLSALSLLSITLMPITATAHCKGKHTGNHEHCTGGGDEGSGEYFGSGGVEFRSPSGVAGFDYYIIGTSGGDEITAGSGTDLVDGGDGGDDIQGLGGDDEIRGEDGSDRINGGEGDDILSGGRGDDQLSGGPGTDSLDGGEGDDRIFFSLGSPTLVPGEYEVEHYDGGPGQDELYFDSNNYGQNNTEFVDGVNVDLFLGTYSATVRFPSGAPFTANGTLSSIEGTWGSAGDDVLRGVDNTPNKFYAAEGDDIIHTFGGNDQIDAGDGNDQIYAGAGNDNISAGDGTDIVYAGPGDDIVSGLSYAGTSVDTFYGEEGCDTFIFNRAFGTVTIMDYNYPYDGTFSCDLIHFRYETFWRADPGDAEINTVGNDIVIDLVIKKGGGVGGTVILKDALLHDVTLEMSDISFEDE